MLGVCVGGPIDGQVWPSAPLVDEIEVEYHEPVPRYSGQQPSPTDTWVEIPIIIARYERALVERATVCYFVYVGDLDE